MPTTGKAVSIYLSPSDFMLLKKLADAERRSISNYVVGLVVADLAKAGYPTADIGIELMLNDAKDTAAQVASIPDSAPVIAPTPQLRKPTARRKGGGVKGKQK